MQNSLHQNAPLDRQRVLIFAERPKRQPKVLEDGEIEYGSKRGTNDQTPFYLVLRGLELHGIAYDHVLETVVDVTPEQRQGFA